MGERNISKPTGRDVPALLELRNVTKSFGGLRAVDNVMLTVPKGDLHCLIGPNGAGKSTIFRLIVGYHRADSGQIIYRGSEISHLKPFQRARLGLSIKFQTPSLFQDLTVHQNMRIPLQLHVPVDSLNEEIDERLRLLGLEGLGHYLVRDISHGQRQWLEIGMALAVNPDLLLLDEPTAGMSPEETQRTAEIVRNLNRQGMTIVVIEHDMKFVRALDSRITVLHFGRVFAQGSLREIEDNEEVRQIYLGKK